MKNLIVVIIAAFSFVVGFASSASALQTSESCYVALGIEEVAVGDTVQFSLVSQRSIYGLYQGLVEVYDPEAGGEYILNVYDRQGVITGKYAAHSAMRILTDDFNSTDDPGGIESTDSAVFLAVIPAGNIEAVKIESNGIETNLNVNVSTISCQRTCKIEGEVMNFGVEKCCIGRIPAEQEDGTFVCVKCGDGACSRYEDEYSCYEDCKPIPPPIPQCGDGNVDSGEQCDDNNQMPGDGCGRTCQFEYCGDGAIAWTNPNNYYDFQGRTPTSQEARSPEECDDNNTAPGDGCNGICKIECPEDVNRDGRVNILDLIAVRSHLNEASCFAGNAFCGYADVNRDTVVNILDLTSVRNKLNTTCVNGILILKGSSLVSKISDILAAVIVGINW